jgi:hypothetical protein
VYGWGVRQICVVVDHVVKRSFWDQLAGQVDIELRFGIYDFFEVGFSGLLREQLREDV